jgi:hypothetical protein
MMPSPESSLIPTCNSTECYALKASLISSAASPVLDQVALKGKQGEATAFPPLLERVVEKFGAHFRYVTADAGMTSAVNTQQVREHGKDYLLALKGNHQLWAHATGGLPYPTIWDVRPVAHR